MSRGQRLEQQLADALESSSGERTSQPVSTALTAPLSVSTGADKSSTEEVSVSTSSQCVCVCVYMCLCRWSSYLLSWRKPELWRRID